jgi:hypothetical protein
VVYDGLEVSMAEASREKSPKCGPGRYADVLKEHNVHEADENVWADTDYRMLRCAGCKTVYFQKIGTFSEDYEASENPNTGDYEYVFTETITYWPSPSKRKRPDWVSLWDIGDAVLCRVMDETYKALDIDLRILAGIAVRTVFDRASETLGIDPAITFTEKVEKLFETGKIGKDEKEHLAVLTEAGGAAAHRAWEPSVEEISALMDIMEAFVYRTFILDPQVASMKSKLPLKPKRQKPPTPQ